MKLQNWEALRIAILDASGWSKLKINGVLSKNAEAYWTGKAETMADFAFLRNLDWQTTVMQVGWDVDVREVVEVLLKREWFSEEE